MEDEKTPLQFKLEKLADTIGAFAKLGAFVIFCVLCFYWLVKTLVKGNTLVSQDSLLLLLDNFAICVAILIVSVPEGLPLAISIAMAFSSDKLQDDHLLIKNLDSLETSGMLLDVMTGKTATLTEGKLEVTKLRVGDQAEGAVQP